MQMFPSNALSELRATHRSARAQAKLNRLLSPYAFQAALEQPQRWHLFYDGEQVVSVVAQGTGETRSWAEGPKLSKADLAQPQMLKAGAKALLEGWKPARQNQTGLGVVLHLADQLDLGLVQEDFENPELFEQARAIVRETPAQVVTDLSEQPDPAIQWRYYPIIGAQRAVALRHQVEFLPAFEALADLDVKVAVHSAPVEILAIYLKLCRQAIDEKPHCFVFFYDHFTVLAPAYQGLLNIAVLPHRQQEFPAAFGDDLFSLLETLGFVASCVLSLIRCGTRDPTLLFNELDAYTRRLQKSADGIEIQIPDNEMFWHALDELAHGKVKPAIVQRPEFLSEYREWFGAGKEFPLSSGIESDIRRFGALSLENFWPDDKQARDKRLPRSLAILMMGLRAGRICGLLFLIGLGAWLTFFVAAAFQGEALRVLPDIIRGKRADFEQLTATREYLDRWDKILTPRSQAWSAMDFILDLLPEGKDIVCDKIRYAMKQADMRGGATGSNTASGFSREWVIDGFCDDQGRTYIARLQEASAIKGVFASTAARLSDPGFAISGKRTVKVVLREEANPQFANATPGAGLPYKFLLVVTQIISGDDPSALSILTKEKTANANP
jgi:hypothetical protein